MFILSDFYLSLQREHFPIHSFILLSIMKKFLFFIIAACLAQHSVGQEYTKATCADVNSGEDGLGYEVTGVITHIESADNDYHDLPWRVSDETGTILINEVDLTKPYYLELLGIGSDIVIKGIRKSESGAVGLTGCEIVEFGPTALRVYGVEEIPAEGGQILVHGVENGEGLVIGYDKEKAGWLTYESTDIMGGSETGGFYYYFTATANEGAPRSATVSFSTTKLGTTYTNEITISQNGKEPTAVSFVGQDAELPLNTYNLNGQTQVTMSRGLIIVRNGKKMFVR